MFRILIFLKSFYSWTIIPTLQDLRGLKYVEARLGGKFHPIPHLLSPGSHGRTYLHSIESLDDADSDLIFASSTPLGNLSVAMNHHDVSILDDIGWISIGPGSDLVSEFGAVDVVRDQIILGSTDDWFLTHWCATNTITKISTRLGVVAGFASTPKVFSTVSVSVGSIHTTASLIFEPIEYVLRGPTALFEEIYSSIGNSQISGIDRVFFGSCSRIIGHLPVIRFIHFTDSDNHEHIIKPYEYVRRISNTNDVCELLISDHRETAMGSDLLFNPLRLQGVHFRATSDHILLCGGQISH